MGIRPNSFLFFFFFKKNQLPLLWDFLNTPSTHFRLQCSDSFVSQPFPKGENYLGKVIGEVSNCITFVSVEKWENSDPGSVASTI